MVVARGVSGKWRSPTLAFGAAPGRELPAACLPVGRAGRAGSLCDADSESRSLPVAARRNPPSVQESIRSLSCPVFDPEAQTRREPVKAVLAANRSALRLSVFSFLPAGRQVRFQMSVCSCWLDPLSPAASSGSSLASTAWRISSIRSALSSRKCLEFSLPWPSRTSP